MSDHQSAPPDFLTPHSVEAEEALLGAVLINPMAILDVASFLQPDDFFILRNSWVWEAILRIQERGEAIDNLTVVEELRAQSRSEEVGGGAYITYLINNTPTSLHAEVYGRIVERAAIRRRILEAASDIARLANAEDADIHEVIDRSEATLFAVTSRRKKKDLIPIRQALSEYFERVEYLYENRDESLGIPTGFNDLDKLLGGLQKSDLVILAARPGMGKTSLILNMAMNASRIGNARVAVFTLEMSNEQLVQRLMSSETGINTQRLRLGQLDDREWGLFVQASGTLGNLTIFLDDTPAISPIQMRGKCRQLYREYGLDLVIVDYLQLMSMGTGRYNENRVQEVSAISRHLKELARELNVPVIAASQLSRAVEQRGDKRPVLSDLRESGCLAGDTLVLLESGESVPIRELVGLDDFSIWAVNPATMKFEAATVSHAFATGVKSVLCLTTQSGKTIRATGNHKFLTQKGWRRLDQLKKDDQIAVPYQAEIAHHMPYADISPMRQSDILWDSILSIEADGKEEVYDLTVPELHNFVANNIVVHNSIEQDADVVMFIYRDEVYNEDTERPNQADIIVAKHRNGPVGAISLYFRKELTQFTNLKHTDIDLSDF
jgi:replicative DNA helicase